MELMAVRRGIIAGQPHQLTASGVFVQIKTDMAAPLNMSGSGNVTICGKNLFDGQYPNIGTASALTYRPIYIGTDSAVTISTDLPYKGTNTCDLFFFAGKVSSGGTSTVEGVSRVKPRTVTPVDGYVTIGYRIRENNDPRNSHTQIEIGPAVTDYEQYVGTTAAIETARKSLAGINNIWSDNGNVTVKYWTH